MHEFYSIKGKTGDTPGTLFSVDMKFWRLNVITFNRLPGYLNAETKTYKISGTDDIPDDITMDGIIFQFRRGANKNLEVREIPVKDVPRKVATSSAQLKHQEAKKAVKKEIKKLATIKLEAEGPKDEFETALNQFIRIDFTPDNKRLNNEMVTMTTSEAIVTVNKLGNSAAASLAEISSGAVAPMITIRVKRNQKGGPLPPVAMKKSGYHNYEVTTWSRDSNGSLKKHAKTYKYRDAKGPVPEPFTSQGYDFTFKRGKMGYLEKNIRKSKKQLKKEAKAEIKNKEAAKKMNIEALKDKRKTEKKTVKAIK